MCRKKTDRKMKKSGTARVPFFLLMNLLSGSVVLDVVTLFESVNASAGINEFLLTGKIGMALRADIHAKVLLGGRCCKNSTASASDFCCTVVGMDALFHSGSPLRSYLCGKVSEYIGAAFPNQHSNRHSITTKYKLQELFLIFFNFFKLFKRAARLPSDRGEWSTKPLL